MGPPFFNGGNGALKHWETVPEWLQWGRRFSTAETAFGRAVLGRTADCFNGAAVFQRRKRPPADAGHTPAKELQWGRRFSTAETRPPRRSSHGRRKCFNGAAVFQRRKPLAESHERCGVGSASMGPPFFNGGNSLIPAPMLNAFSLQWGRR